MEFVHRTGRLGAMDVVEVNPSIGNERDVKTTVDAALSVILAGFGHSRRGRKPKHVKDMPVQTFFTSDKNGE